MIKIAIIGAGLAGLTAANLLKKHAHIRVFEKSRGPGGRMATRYAEEFHFDHGAQFFQAKTDEFRNFINPMIKEGIIKEWHARFVEFENSKMVSSRAWDSEVPHYVGVNGMNEIGKYLSKNIDIHYNSKVTPVNEGAGWKIIDEQGKSLGYFDWVIVTAPAEQTVKLLPSNFEGLSEISSIKMTGCFSLMLGFEKPLSLYFDAALVRDADISWISVNSSKPGRLESFCLLVHSTNKWADSHIEDDVQQVLDYLVNEASKVIGHDLNIASHKAIHRWRYANIGKQEGKKYFIDPKLKIAACGDWCIQGRIESSFTSSFGLCKELF